MTVMGPAQKVHLAIDCLSELLDILCPDPNPDVFTLESFMYVYKLTGLNETAVQHIEQTQRVNRAVGDFRQIGLNEFHIGLIYLYWEEFHAAEKQFDNARRQWSIVNEPALISLAHLGLGFAQELTFHYELAMSSFSKSRQNLSRIRYAAPPDDYGRFQQVIEQCIDDAQQALRELMRRLPDAPSTAGSNGNGAVETQSEAEPEPEADDVETPDLEADTTPEPEEPEEATGIHPPIDNMTREPMPIEGHVKVERRYHWYQVEKHSLPELIPFVQPGDWLLVYTQPEAEMATQPADPSLVVVYESENDGTIQLKPQRPWPRPSTGQRIHMQHITLQTGPFVIENGQAIFTKEAEQVAVDLANILGIVIGFWRPVSKPE